MLQIPNLLPVLIASRKRGARTRLKIAILNKFLQYCLFCGYVRGIRDPSTPCISIDLMYVKVLLIREIQNR